MLNAVSYDFNKFGDHILSDKRTDRIPDNTVLVFVQNYENSETLSKIYLRDMTKALPVDVEPIVKTKYGRFDYGLFRYNTKRRSIRPLWIVGLDETILKQNNFSANIGSNLSSDEEISNFILDNLKERQRSFIITNTGKSLFITNSVAQYDGMIDYDIVFTFLNNPTEFEKIKSLDSSYNGCDDNITVKISKERINDFNF